MQAISVAMLSSASSWRAGTKSPVCSIYVGCLVHPDSVLAVIDNFHNSFPTSLERVQKIALDSLPANASQDDKDACKVDLVQGDLRDRSVFKTAFQKYSGSEKIYAVILVAALKAVGESGEIPIE